MAAAAGGSSAATAAAKRVAETAARIFGNWIGNGERSGRKVLRKHLIGEQLATYYPEPIYDPLFEDPDDKRRATLSIV